MKYFFLILFMILVIVMKQKKLNKYLSIVLYYWSIRIVDCVKIKNKNNHVQIIFCGKERCIMSASKWGYF